MKTVYPSDEIPHLWAHQTQDHARNGHGDNLSFLGKSIKSYWSQIGWIVKPGQCVLLNEARYSVTTTKHQDMVRRAIRHFPHIFSVDVRHDACALQLLKGPAIVANYRARAVSLLEKARRAKETGNRPRLLGEAAGKIEKANEARAYFKCRSKPITADSLTRDVDKLFALRSQEMKVALANRKERERVATARAVEYVREYMEGTRNHPPGRQQRARLNDEQHAGLVAFETAKFTAEATKEAQLRIDGLSIDEMPWNLRNYVPEEMKEALKSAFVRINADKALAYKEGCRRLAEAFVAGTEKRFNKFDEDQIEPGLLARVNARRVELNKEAIQSWRNGIAPNSYMMGDVPVILRAKDGEMQTSQGATVPLADAERAFKFVIARRAKGWHKNGETHAIGHYQLDAVNAQGVVAGCHRVSWEEIETFARSQGWLSGNPFDGHCATNAETA